MIRSVSIVGAGAIAIALAAFVSADHLNAAHAAAASRRPLIEAHDITTRRSLAHDVSPSLAPAGRAISDEMSDAADDPDLDIPAYALAPGSSASVPTGPIVPPRMSVPTGAAAVEQTAPGTRPAPAIVASFDGLGVGFVGPQGTARLRNPSDNTLAVGRDYIVQIVNTRMAIFTKKGAIFDTTGKVLYGPVETNNVFRGFAGDCAEHNNGDAVARYDQLADRWLIVMPVFTRLFSPTDTAGRAAGMVPAERPGHYAMCYAVSMGPSPFGPYYRYEFRRALFPDYPRPAIWPDGYYVPTSTGDNVIQKHVCVADRASMLRGADATEQCVIVDGVNFLNVADLDGRQLPPPGTPAIVLAAGGTQLKNVMEDDGIYAWRLHVDWADSANTKLIGPVKIAVAPYHYLCDGQLTNCVPQPGTERRLDAQGDKLMSRVTYRRIGDQQSIVAAHSVNTAAGAGGVRWYEIRLAPTGELSLYQQGTFAPDSFYRWMGSAAMDARGNIGIGYSFGGTPNFAGQRFAGRLSGDPKGELTLHETVLAEGEAPQTATLRWEDYSQTAVDPSDDCTIWYVGDYFKANAESYSTRIGGFRMPGCGAE